jgi:hypothetical protein
LRCPDFVCPIVFFPPLWDFAAMSIKHAAMGLVLLAPLSLAAADLFYKKNLTLHVIHDVEQGKSKSSRLDTAVSKYTADAGAVLYLKGQSLYLIRNTREPKAELLDRGVSDFGFRDGLIAYVRNSHLHVRRLAEDSNSPARRLADSQGVTSFDIDGGIIVFLKNGSGMYRVIDLDQGRAVRVAYPVTEIQVSKSK